MTPKNVPPSSKGHSPKSRVEAYIRDWHASWKKHVAPHMNRDGMGFADFNVAERWEEATDALRQKHYGPHAHLLRNSGSSMSSTPDYDPKRETIVSEHQAVDTAAVSTETGLSWGPKYREYQVTREKSIWYLRAIYEYYNNETEPAFTAEEREALLKHSHSRRQSART